MSKDYYSVLGLGRDASADDIKRAYRKLSKELHPDRNKDNPDAEQKFQEVNEAYEVLNDPQKRKMYDQFGTAGGPGGAGGQGFGGFDGFDFSGFSGQGGAGGFSDIFESFFGGQRGGGRPSNRGSDVEIGIRISMKEAFSGAEKTVQVSINAACDACDGEGHEKGSSMKNCDECGGTGQVTRTAQSFFGTIRQSVVCPKCQGHGTVPEKPCAKCAGEGRLQQKKDLAVHIPAGIDDGQTLRLQHQGEAGRQGGAAGDLYVHVSVDPDDTMKREGDDMHSTREIHVLEALLGSEVSIETLHGTVQMKVPAGTQPGHKLRIKNKGMPILGTSRYGDHYVTVRVNIPNKLSRKEQKVLGQWKEVADI